MGSAATPRTSEFAEMTSRAEVTTDKPVAYMRQLCKHFGHKVDASFGEDSGHIQFEFGRCELRQFAYVYETRPQRVEAYYRARGVGALALASSSTFAPGCRSCQIRR